MQLFIYNKGYKHVSMRNEGVHINSYLQLLWASLLSVGKQAMLRMHV